MWRDRAYALAQMANTLHGLGYGGLRANGLKGKHIEALVRDWSDRGLSDATMMNRMARVRWWADRVGKGNLVKPNAEYGIEPRSHVADGTKRRDLDDAKLAPVKDGHVRMALRLQAAFGLRREEAIKFTPPRDDRGACIRLKASTTKGGRPREVPVRNAAQRGLLDEARRLAGGGALIRAGSQLRRTEEGLRGPDPGGGAGPQPRAEARVRSRPLRGSDGLDLRRAARRAAI